MKFLFPHSHSTYAVATIATSNVTHNNIESHHKTRANNPKNTTQNQQQTTPENNKKTEKTTKNNQFDETIEVGVLDITRLLFNDGIQLNGLPAPRADTSSASIRPFTSQDSRFTESNPTPQQLNVASSYKR